MPGLGGAKRLQAHKKPPEFRMGQHIVAAFLRPPIGKQARRLKRKIMPRRVFLFLVTVLNHADMLSWTYGQY